MSNWPFNRLSDGQAERLAMLAEEAGEIVQAVGKILRHGYGSRHPDGGPTNKETLERECGDFRGVMHHMVDRGDLEFETIAKASGSKMAKARRYMHHADEGEAP